LARDRGLPSEEGQLTVRGHGVCSTWDFTPLDVSRLTALGWRAKTPLRRGLEDIYAWFRERWEGVVSPRLRHLRRLASPLNGCGNAAIRT
jgi:hypothetical protein